MELQGFYAGHAMDAFEYFGAHYTPEQTTFRTFAPGARGISIMLMGQEIPMQRVYDGNFYECVVPDVKPGATYEYRVYTQDGGYTDHCDPFGFEMELRPDHKSVVVDLSTYKFADEKWMKSRTTRYDEPLNIYEMHAGSWRTPPETEERKWYRYDEIAPLLIPYLKESGYNYVEFLPLCEHPSDESWGYQNTGFYAPTRRYGTPDDLKRMINELHRNDIGVLLDFVPVHFAVDAYGLGKFDGTALYEYPNNDVGVSEWGSYNFMHSRGEVRSFLQSAVNFWLSEYHFDGVRMDAISRIIYWQGDPNRGVNGNAVDFIKVMNSSLKQLHPTCILVAEDSTDYRGTTTPVNQGGLGYDYKWDMGWMHDTLEYMQTPPQERIDKYHKLTWSMMYFRNERYLLPFSHDEVVHGKATILQKMHGDYEGKFPQGRALYMYMMVHPGKKLNFMGSEIGQLREWDEKREQDWFLRKYPNHDSFYHYMAKLNELYLTHSALYEWDYEEKGFRWLDCNQMQRRVYAILRMSEDESMISIFNFSDEEQAGYTVEVPEDIESIEQLLYSDWEPYGGETPVDQTICTLEDGILTCTLAPCSGILLGTARKKETKADVTSADTATSATAATVK